MVRMELTNRAQAYMSVESKALNVLCLQNSKAELKVDVQNLTVNASSFATVELFGNAVRMALDAESNSRIWMERNDGE